MRIPIKLTLAALVLSLAAAAASAQTSTIGASSPWAETDHTRVRLVAATSATGSADKVRLGLQFKLIPGWKVYWRSPGAAGFPPVVDWSGSSNLAGAEMLWPAPHRFKVLGLDTLGYKDEVIFPIDVRLTNPKEPLAVAARVNYLTCNEICVPYEANLALALPTGPAFPSPFGTLIDRFAARVPGDGSAAGLKIVDSAVVGAAGDQVLQVVATADPAFAAPDLFVEADDRFEFGAPRIAYDDGRQKATFSIDVATVGSDRPDLSGNDLVLTLVDASRAAEVAVADVQSRGESADAGAFIAILALALLGGLILNLMPCVLPVLSLKLLSVVKHGGGVRHEVRAGFLATAAGIVFSFLVIAAALIVVKAGGMAVGWGIQFQQPAFLIAMTFILTLFAANLWGLFEFRLPGDLGDRLGTPAHITSLRGHFVTGAFATLLATPCSAPFLGSAVGFALSRGPLDIAAVFLALGVGLAIPYLLVAAFPAVATSLPRPGPWMVVLRRVLGVALVGTAVWLLSVLAAETGAIATVAVVGAIVVILAAIWFGPRLLAPANAVAWGVAIIATAVAFAVPAFLEDHHTEGPIAAKADGVWTPFDADAISGLVRNGKVVFVDVTADWCLTCKVNKRLVLETNPVAVELADTGVVAMQADWTRPDDRIAAYLSRYGRYGIPFNAVYGPGAPHGVPLPELLNSDDVMAAIVRARAGG
jgi:suppressor for copper-sensitivity B